MCPKPSPSENKDKESSPLTELHSANLEIFRFELTQRLTERFQGHWYPDDPVRGSAYRSISYDTRMDAIFLAATEKAGIDRIEDRLEHVRYYIMFINPGEVKVKNTRLWTSEAKYIWSKKGEDDSSSASPPTSPRPDSKSSTSRDDITPSPNSTNSLPTSTGSSDSSIKFYSNSPSSRGRSSPNKNGSINSQLNSQHKSGPSPFMSSVPQAPRHSPSPPPLSLDHSYLSPNSFNHSFPNNYHFKESSPGTVQQEPTFSLSPVPSHSQYGRNPISDGYPPFPFNHSAKFGYSSRSRTPSPPLLAPGENYYRSHPARPGPHQQHSQHSQHSQHEPIRPHTHGLQHEYNGGNRFFPRYRSMGVTR